MAQEADERVPGSINLSGDEGSSARPRTVAPPRPFDEESNQESPDPLDEPEETVEPGIELTEAASGPARSEPFEDLSELPSLIEALLFVADHPIEESYLARALEVSQPRIVRALEDLAESLRASTRGIRLQRGPEGAQLVSAPEAAPHVERFLGLEANRRLSTAALETLAIIAYRQPVTRGQIDAIRGVSSDGAIQTLRARGLIESAGHASGPGRPMLLRTTQRFLEHFGLERPGQLPPLPDDVELPPAEISAQLGLDEALVEEALVQASGEPEQPALSDAVDEGHLDATRGESPGAVDADVDADDDVAITTDLRALAEAAGQAFAQESRSEATGEEVAADTPDDRHGPS